MSTEPNKYQISLEDLEAIKKAKSDMENLSWAIKGVNKLGYSLEKSQNLYRKKL